MSQDENLQLRERELQHLTKRLTETSKHLEDLESRSSSSEEAATAAKLSQVKLEKENRRLKVRALCSCLHSSKSFSQNKICFLGVASD